MNFNLARWCVKHRQVVYFFTVLIFIAGIYSFHALGRSEDPSFVVRQMVISAAWPGATADQMQDLVTSKLDKMVQATPDIDYITSYSRPGVSVVNVILKEQVPNAEVRKHWLEVRNYVNDHASELPSGVYGPYFDDRFDDVYGNIYALTSDSFSLEDLRVEAEELKRQFYTVPDVNKVELIGEQPMRIYVRMSNAKLAELGLTLEQVTSAINGETTVAPTGVLDTGGDNVYMRVTGLTEKLDDIRAILINAGGRTFRLGDIATVTQEYPDPPEPKMYVNGQQAVGIAISMADGGNNITLGHNLAALTGKMEKILPLGMELKQVANQPKVVEDSISEFSEGLYEAIIIVLVVSLFSMGRQCGYVISVCIPLVLMGAFVGMYLAGIDLHKISLGSLIISLGMLVDDAIVVVELMEVKMSEGMAKKVDYWFNKTHTGHIGSRAEMFKAKVSTDGKLSFGKGAGFSVFYGTVDTGKLTEGVINETLNQTGAHDWAGNLVQGANDLGVEAAANVAYGAGVVNDSIVNFAKDVKDFSNLAANFGKK